MTVQMMMVCKQHAWHFPGIPSTVEERFASHTLHFLNLSREMFVDTDVA